MFSFLYVNQMFVVVGLLLVLLELIIGIEAGFDLVLIGSILLLSGFAGIATGNYVVALVLASVLSAAYIFYGRKLIKSKLVYRTKHTNIDKLIGQSGTVVQPIRSGSAGMIKINDEEWRARSTDQLEPGETVRVVAVEGVTLEVQSKVVSRKKRL